MRKTVYSNARRIVCEEWQQAAKDYGLKPGSPLETVIAKILGRLDEAGRTPEPPPPAPLEYDWRKDPMKNGGNGY